jgi:ubiquinone/menaquinone biosynthesis C-methylase UbiE
LALYDKIGQSYDTTRQADSYITSRLRFHLKTVPDGKYLDMACGSGNYAIALKNSGLIIYGIDISERMVALAHQKAPEMDWLLGDVEELPFPNSSFSGATCVLAIHHFKNLQWVFDEAARVISAGRLVVFTATAEQVQNYWLNKYFPEAMRKSIEQIPGKQTIEKALKKAGFGNIYWEPYIIKDDLQDFFLYIGKNRPEMYLNPQVRQGSSTFASLADPCEIEKGCELLKQDILSGNIAQVMKAYSAKAEGDYIFAVAERGETLSPQYPAKIKA